MSEPLRVLQIVSGISLLYGGPSQMVLGLSAALAREGVEVTVLTTNSSGNYHQPLIDVPLNKPVEQHGYQILYFHSFNFKRYKISIDLLRWLAAHATEFDIAHIHALFSPVCTIAATIARERNLPYILRPLGTLDPADLHKKKLLKQIYVALLEKRNLAGAAAIHFTSVQEAKVSERFGTSTPDVVIPLGVELPAPLPKAGTARTHLGIPPDKPMLLFMSRIDPKKGLNLLIPALEKLLAEGVDFHFVLAGRNQQDPTYEKKILTQVQASPLGDRTTITGFVDGELKASLLQDADLFILPSYYENFGIAVAEAMCHGTPVVISEQVYIWEEVRDSEAGWVCPCDSDALTQMLRLALADASERQRRGWNAREYARKNYNWSAIAQQTIQVYQQILC